MQGCTGVGEGDELLQEVRRGEGLREQQEGHIQGIQPILQHRPVEIHIRLHKINDLSTVII